MAVQIIAESAKSVERVKGRKDSCSIVHFGVNSSSVQNTGIWAFKKGKLS